MLDMTENKRELLEAELLLYFGGTCPALVARCWEAANVGLAPPIFRELAARLQALKTVTDATIRNLDAGYIEAAGSHAPAEHLLDRALASLEHLGEIAQALMQRLDELLRNQRHIRVVRLPTPQFWHGTASRRPRAPRLQS